MTERTPLQEAMEALRPFASASGHFGGDDDSQTMEVVFSDNPDFTLGDLRRAAAAFDSISNHLKGEGDG
jgi:hypothetical protein